jgi:phosphoenolpyruvate synthase/pyruvate phosphate dikinase
MEENVKTSIKIAGRIYPLFIHKDEMTKVKYLEKQINDTYNNMQIQYAISDKFDCLAMTLLTLLSEKDQEVVESNQDELAAVIDMIEATIADIK